MWQKLKTFWAKLKGWRTMLVSLVLALVGVLQTADWATIVRPDQVGPVILAIAIAVAVLRTLTSTPIGKQ